MSQVGESKGEHDRKYCTKGNVGQYNRNSRVLPDALVDVFVGRGGNVPPHSGQLIAGFWQ